ncbi:MAG TPA: low specificity L-threonine aldolase [Candidatus Limnocylindria bacterium]|nr:low specificity L-threonine aldolase [Candidatus Limnocylindria bacterium]
MTTDQGPTSDPPAHERRGFGSDNYSGVHPDVLASVTAVNVGHQPAYGDDITTERLRTVVRAEFGDQAEVYPVFNGTGANVVGLQALTRPWEAVICAETAHLNVDECGAPEKVAGLKLLTVPTPDGRLTPELVDRKAHSWGDPHRVQPRVVSVTQSTELGTVYSLDDLRALADHAHGLGMALHMDGARVANAAASLGVSLRALTTDVGVDVLSFGGTKNGLLLGEAVVVLDPSRVEGVEFLRKSSMQLASKMRYVSSQLLALFDGELWRCNAAHANAMAQRLAAAVEAVDDVHLSHDVQANAVFATMPRAAIGPLQESYAFYVWDESTDQVRWVCSWDTTPDDVDALALALAREVGRVDR